MLSPTTELEAVNIILDYIGDPPVNSLADIEGSEASRALSLLRETTRRFQTRGYSFNTEYVILRVDSNGLVAVPPNTLQIQPLDNRYILRGNRLYDRLDNTRIITEDVKAKLIQGYSFEELPEPARYLIAVTAARKYAVRALGETSLIQMIQQDEQSATREFMEFELKQERPYLFTDLDHSIIERDTAPQERGGLF